MEKTEKTKKKSRIVPITCFILCLASCGFNGEIAGFFLFLAFITFLFTAMMDPVEKPIVPKAVDSLDEWTARKPFDLFGDVSCNCMAETQVTVASGIGEVESQESTD